MPEQLAVDPLAAARLGLDAAVQLNQAEIDWYLAEAQYYMTMAQIQNQLIQNATDAEKLRQLQTVFEQYLDRITELKADAQEAERHKARIEKFVRQASFLLLGADCPDAQKWPGHAAFRGLLRMYGDMTKPAILAGLNALREMRESRTLHDIGSSGFAALSESLEQLKESIQPRLNELAQDIKQLDAKRDELRQAESDRVSGRLAGGDA